MKWKKLGEFCTFLRSQPNPFSFDVEWKKYTNFLVFVQSRFSSWSCSGRLGLKRVPHPFDQLDHRVHLCDLSGHIRSIIKSIFGSSPFSEREPCIHSLLKRPLLRGQNMEQGWTWAIPVALFGAKTSSLPSLKSSLKKKS